MGCLVHAYCHIYPTRYYNDDSCWSADLKSKTTEDIISIGSFVEVLVLIQYVLVRKILRNTKNNRIQQTSSSKEKNKRVEVQPRKFKSFSNKNNHASDCNIVEIVLWYLDFECSKDMTKQHDKLITFVSKFNGSVRFKNDHFAAIMGYGDLQIGNLLISRVYYVEGLGHNLFSVGQFCDSYLEATFHKHTCFVRNLKGVDLLSGSLGTNLYTISLEDMMKSSPICLLSKASMTKSWPRRHRKISDVVASLKLLGFLLRWLHPDAVTLFMTPSLEGSDGVAEKLRRHIQTL
ncbi:hypothetical protein Tco_0533499 [Tanacetum coccineum]